MTTQHALRLAVDIGGTFTDTVLINESDSILATTKTPMNPTLGALEGAERVLDAMGAS